MQINQKNIPTENIYPWAAKNISFVIILVFEIKDMENKGTLLSCLCNIKTFCTYSCIK